MARLSRLISVRDFERAARRTLPRPIFDVIAGGAGDETTVQENQRALGRLRLRPRSFVDIRQRDLSTTVLGDRISLPVVLAPVGYQRMLHRDAELASARAAARLGTVFALNSVSSYPLEEVASEARAPRWYQLYMPGDRDAADELLARVEDAGYRVLCLTVDTPMAGMRERDIRNRITQPLKIGPRMVLSAASRPAWAFDFVRGGAGRGLKPVGRLPMSLKDAGKAIAKTGKPVSFEDLAWLRERWPGPLLVKGVLRGDDCAKIMEYGVDGVVVSNHGGRQLDSSPPTIEVLPEIVAAVGDRAEVFIDGGFRRGTDVVKALALGARAVLIGRPYLYGLAVGGQQGVERVLEILREEIDTAVGMLGCTSVGQLGSGHVAQGGGPWPDRPVPGPGAVDGALALAQDQVQK